MEFTTLKFDSFISSLKHAQPLASRIEQLTSGQNPDLFLTLIEEAKYTVSVISPYIKKDLRVLEVGAGCGLVSAFLIVQGFNVVALEPGAGGFDFSAHLFREVKSYFKIPDDIFQECDIEKLPKEIGPFDLIFSSNVLEHITDLENNIIRLDGRLAVNGKMIHICPNYLVPFEPHLGIPLVPFFPKWTSFFLSSRVLESSLWKSFNFITSSLILRVASKESARVRFLPDVMWSYIQRIFQDPGFAGRHRVLARVFLVLKKCGILALFRLIPPRFATPMVFEWKAGASK